MLKRHALPIAWHLPVAANLKLAFRPKLTHRRSLWEMLNSMV